MAMGSRALLMILVLIGAVAIAEAAQCDSNQVCPNGLCCSQYGYCGCSSDFCGNGCQSQCGGCSHRSGRINGEATYYTNYVPSECYGNDQSRFPPGPMIARVSSDVFNHNAACGHMYDITCRGGANGGDNPCTEHPTVRVKVVDVSRETKRNTFELSQQAFSRIANTDAGRLRITAERVSDVEFEGIAQVV